MCALCACIVKFGHARLWVLTSDRPWQARDASDADEGAEMGIAPWKLGNLAACILLWGVLWKQPEPTRFKEVPVSEIM